MTTADQLTYVDAPPAADPQRPWIRALVWVSVFAAAVDLGRPALVGAVIPPLAVGAGLTVVGLLLLRRRWRVGVAMLGLTNLLLVVTSAPFALPDLAHPESPLSFGHATIHLVGRLIAVAAAVGAWRRASPAGAQRLGFAAAGLLALTVILSAVSMLLTTSDTAEPGDVTVEVRNVAFPSEVRVASGGNVLVDNADLVRHTFTVNGTDLSQGLPEGSSVRIGVDLDPGTYRLYCAVPGHESMTGVLVVE